MTQEEQLKIQAKAYTELINRLEDVKNAIKKQNYGIAMDILYKPYPEFQITTYTELKESEDERIMGNIIATIHLYYGEPLEDEAKEMIAWLEKQGEHANFRNKIQIGDKVTRNEDGVLVNLSQLNRVAKKDEKQGEQKPNDKVKSKFKVGDWISGYYTNYKVLSVNNEGYVVEDVDGNKINILFENEKFHHLWTIQDAKDGDVLVDSCAGYKNPLIFILKKFEHKDFGLAEPSDYSSYCFLTMSNKQDFKEGFYHHMHNIHPATKEQRDLLFQKMHEAGYEWDAEKKELKKIEPKPAEWSSRDDSYFEELTEASGLNELQIEWLTEIKDRVLQQPKQEWSEKDNKKAERIIRLLQEAYDINCINGSIEWLKSLRPQNTWKPSDEQIDMLKIAVSTSNSIVLDSLYNDLKKLKG